MQVFSGLVALTAEPGQGGVAWFAHIGGFLVGLLTVRALTPTDDERLIREFVLQLKLGKTSIRYFNEKFSADVLQRFATPLQTLKDWGFLTIEGDSLILNRDGLLQVDRLLHEFFLPEHKNARYA